jgi:hypothetical protein
VGCNSLAGVGNVSVCGKNEDFRIEDCFVVSKDGRRLVQCFNELSRVSIPGSVEVVGERCFSGCKSLSEVIFPADSHVTRLETWCFSRSGFGGADGCPIQKIVLPASLEVVGGRCFSGCKSLSEVIFPADSQVTRLEEECFSRCPIQKIVLPASLEVVGERCFWGCKSLSEVIFPADSHVTRLEKGCFYGCPIQKMELPARLEFVGQCSLAGVRNVSVCEKNEHFRIEECFLASVDGRRLVQCFNELSRVSIPGSVEVVGERCFSGCDSLSEVIFPADSHVARLEKECFSGSDRLGLYGCRIQKIVLPASLEVVGERCFSGCDSLSEVIFPADSHVTRLEKGCFCGCRIQKMELPAGLEFVGECSLAGVRSVSVCEKNEHFRIEECFLASVNGRRLVQCFNEFRRVSIPGSVEVVGERCFSGCDSLSEVIFPADSHVTRLENSCFYGCPIQRIVLPASLEVVGGNCFYGCQS